MIGPGQRDLDLLANRNLSVQDQSGMDFRLSSARAARLLRADTMQRTARAATSALHRPAQRPPTTARAQRPPTSSSPFSSTTTKPIPVLNCPSCSTPLQPTQASEPTCPHCTAFLPVPDPPPSFYALFGLPRSFVVDRSAVKRNYLRWQQRVHPDLAAGKANHAKGKGAATGGDVAQDEARVRRLQDAWARDWSSVVNKANSTLSDDLRRAEYLVGSVIGILTARSAGLTGREQLNQAGLEIGEEDAVSDPELLMSILETREALEEATTEDEVAAIRATNQGPFAAPY